MKVPDRTAEERAEAAFAPVADVVREGRIPGAVLGVLAGGERALRWAGAAQLVPHKVAMTRETWFDLASLTKVVFTTTAILRLVEAGRIGLDDPLTVAIPDLRQYDLQAAERRLTFRQCLTHATHLPHVEPLYTYGQDPRTLRAFILQREWRPGPAVYSDINFMLLGIAIERLTGRPLDQSPLSPGYAFMPDPSQCAATEFCTWRGRVMRGQVHDENAFALGGASGHAGLFGTADALLDFAAGLLDGTRLGPDGLIAIRTPASATRAVGWEIRHDGWPGGDACPAGTIGHTASPASGFGSTFRRGSRGRC